jgi:hypothetical protein
MLHQFVDEACRCHAIADDGEGFTHAPRLPRMQGLETREQFPLRARPTFFNASDAGPFREKHFVTKSILK